MCHLINNISRSRWENYFTKMDQVNFSCWNKREKSSFLSFYDVYIYVFDQEANGKERLTKKTSVLI